MKEIKREKKTLLFLLLIFFLQLVFLVSPALVMPRFSAEEQAEFTSTQHARWEFGERIDFEARGSSPLREATIFYQIEGDPGFRFKKAECYSRGARITIPLGSGEIPPAASIRYFWQLRDSSGNLFRTDPSEFCYLDQRFAWQSEKQEKITVFWYGELGRDFAESVFAQLDKSFARINEKLGFVQKEPIKIILYQSRLAAEPAVVNIAAGQIWGRHVSALIWHRGWEQSLTHELTHLLTLQLIEKSYVYLPFWLSEGLAAYADGWSRGALGKPFPFLTLTAFQPEVIPPQAAYAQAQSVITFLIEECGGKERITQLLKAARTSPFEEAFRETYELELSEFERAWQKHIEATSPSIYAGGDLR